MVVTTHGEHHYLKLLGEGDRDAMTSKGFVYIDSGYGESVALPGFYQTAFHSGTYIREHWNRYFDVIDILPPSASGHQDTVLAPQAEHLRSNQLAPPLASATFCLPALIQGIIPRSWVPTTSIGWALPSSCSRL